ncbi:MAG: DUF262 domain-containing HNH endonuclease family protein, partial [Negativicutes bacterium]|nr:DUF262 domain-containing HNH endonuclease family protein [Negativicutes bacterium]
RTISKILTEQTCYQIPPYQRPYSWAKENVRELLDDIWEAYEEDDKEYFIGSLITIERDKDKLYDVVDGQQRLTTLNLIFARLRDHIENPAAKEELGKRILPRNVLTGEAETPRLVLRKKDQSFFFRHVLESHPVPEANRANLELPQRRIAENMDTIDAFFAGKSQQEIKLFANYILSKVYVVFVNTDSLQSAYRLFNVLNARGLPLSNADLIKNTLFSLLNGQVSQSDVLEERWLELEEVVGIERLDAFLSHHRTAITAAKARGTLHDEYDAIIKKNNTNPFTFLDELIQSAQNYVRILDSAFDDVEALRSLRALHRVEYDEWIAALLAFLNKPVQNLSAAEYISLLEKVTIQNWVRRLGRTARFTVYYQLINAIRNGEGESDVRQIFRNHAKNDEFINLLSGDVYNQPFAAFVLLRLEEAMQDASVTKTYSGRITIEHVLPQAFKDDYWTKRFTPDEHSMWLHRLGNLALLCGSKNYKAQYYGFDRKKKIYTERNNKVSFDSTKEICLEDDWTVEELKKRQERLLQLAQKTWFIN